MSWHVTRSRAEFEAAAEAYLRSDPVINTVPLTVLEALRRRGDGAFGEGASIFGWHEYPAESIDGTFVRTGTYPLFVTGGQRVDALAGLLDPALINLPEPAASEFRLEWAARTGRTAAVRRRMRLHRLKQLIPPTPYPPGTARIAGPADLDLITAFSEDFAADTGSPAGSTSAARDDASRGSIVLWEHLGQPVALARLSPMVANVVRVQAVYTPPEHRRRGYGAAVTTVATQRALDGGAGQVVLFTDLANPTSNALYARLGYEAVADRTELCLR